MNPNNTCTYIILNYKKIYTCFVNVLFCKKNNNITSPAHFLAWKIYKIHYLERYYFTVLILMSEYHGYSPKYIIKGLIFMIQIFMEEKKQQMDKSTYKYKSSRNGDKSTPGMGEIKNVKISFRSNISKTFQGLPQS